MRTFIFSFLIVGITLIFNSCKTTPIRSSEIKKPENLAWYAYRDLSNEEFSTKFDELKKQGYKMKDVDAYFHGADLKFSMIWEKNRDGRKWIENRNMSFDSYHNKLESYEQMGYRLTDVECYLFNSQLRYAAIWEENIEDIEWQSFDGLTASAYKNLVNQKKSEGYRMIDIEAYQTENGTRYACIWYKNVDNIIWNAFKDLTRNKYEELVELFSTTNFRMVDFESYTVDGSQRFAAIWEKNINNYASQIRSNRSELGYANLWRKYRDEGYRLIDFESYETPDGIKYAGVWIENADRYRWSKKRQIDSLITWYRSQTSVPGISVAIIHQGKLVYQRGFGEADISAGKEAHGRSVYSLASISKVIGGTMAVKLESNGQLEDRTNINLDLSKTTRSYLPQLAPAHLHTVEQLMAHLGCVRHYTNGTDTTDPPVAYYPTASSAAALMWNDGLVNGCVIGDSTNYSTHAFVFIGAVLESVTNRSIAQLVQEEINQPYNLNSIRVQFADPLLPYNYERVKPYTSGGWGLDYDDNSWKGLGGGLEGDAVDVAWFGWKVLNGEIVDATIRDNRLWKPLLPSGAYGLTWELKKIGSRRVAEHSGKWVGGRNHLRVYRDAGDQLVIAILTNKRYRIDDGSPPSPASLATRIGNEILTP